MKKQLLVVMIALCYTFSGCSDKYDYRTDTPLGVYQIQLPDSTPDDVVLSEWIGESQIVSSDKQPCTEISYNDVNIAIVACEERIDRYLLTIYYNGTAVLSDAVFDFKCYAGNEYLGTVSSEPQMLVGGLYSSIIVIVPAGTSDMELMQYSATYSGDLQSIKFYDFTTTSLVEHTSETTYIFHDKCNVILCTTDGRIVYGCINHDKGKYTIGRNFVTKYGIVEVK